MTKAQSPILYHIAAAATGMVMIIVLALFSIAILPGETFVRFRLDVAPGAGGEPDVVIQARTMLLPRPFDGEWVATVEKIPLGEDYAVQVCAGRGSSTYRPDRTVYTAPIVEWVGDPNCKLIPGERYRIEAAWRFHVLGFVPQSTSAASAPFVAQ
jgi:hypothetical protein